MIDERRQFNRVDFSTSAIFYVSKQKFECQIIDLSLNGALIKLPTTTNCEIGSIYQLDVPLGEDSEVISMELELMYLDSDKLGLKCTHIDLDSITHLRRLVELNLGDSHLLERDFSSLISDNE